MLGFGNYLKEIRTQRELTQRQLAELIGGDFSYSYICKIELGKKNPPSNVSLELLCDKLSLDRDVTYLMAGRIPDDMIEMICQTPDLMMFLRKIQKKKCSVDQINKLINCLEEI
jgi:HTH-type transcriptional regulator, competence development regulator